MRQSMSLSLWLRRLSTAAIQSVQLLAPHTSACAICGKALRHAGHHHGLSGLLRSSVCDVCLSQIPWLNLVKCPLCGRGVECEDCRRQPHRSFICNRSAVEYDSTMREWLARYKYRGDERLAPLLSDMLLPVFERMTTQIMAGQRLTQARRGRRLKPQHCWDAITFVPISAERSLERGFNQAEQLAAQIADRHELPLLRLLVRDRHTEKMSFKSRRERQRDARSLFRANGEEFLKLRSGKTPSMLESYARRKALRVLLIDDIYTTGSTAEACSEALKLHADIPLEIYILTWARS